MNDIIFFFDFKNLSNGFLQMSTFGILFHKDWQVCLWRVFRERSGQRKRAVIMGGTWIQKWEAPDAQSSKCEHCPELTGWVMTEGRSSRRLWWIFYKWFEWKMRSRDKKEIYYEACREYDCIRIGKLEGISDFIVYGTSLPNDPSSKSKAWNWRNDIFTSWQNQICFCFLRWLICRNTTLAIWEERWGWE